MDNDHVGAHIEFVAEKYATERLLLSNYRHRIADIQHQVNALMNERTALLSIIRGIEALLGEQSVEKTERRAPPPGPDPLIEHLNALTQPTVRYHFSPELRAMTALDLALQVLLTIGHPATAAEIAAAITRRGHEVNYQTLYKTLRREAERDDGRIVWRDEKFALRENAPKGVL